VGKILHNVLMTRNEDCFVYIKKYSTAARTVSRTELAY